MVEPARIATRRLGRVPGRVVAGKGRGLILEVPRGASGGLVNPLLAPLLLAKILFL